MPWRVQGLDVRYTSWPVHVLLIVAITVAALLVGWVVRTICGRLKDDR